MTGRERLGIGKIKANKKFEVSPFYLTIGPAEPQEAGITIDTSKGQERTRRCRRGVRVKAHGRPRVRAKSMWASAGVSELLRECIINCQEITSLCYQGSIAWTSHLCDRNQRLGMNSERSSGSVVNTVRSSPDLETLVARARSRKGTHAHTLALTTLPRTPARARLWLNPVKVD
ncbi:hypothetical protein EVAR_94374_1 [Eumeta japonica]|uniref:Uncharacterized protein n=1 Tax=Eumeta variegata TaxID=151549 RepID=A0A4C1TPX6_EUMVA|nr:hypothetical protein EVAR_94374_1 [Eumeta japonica]